MESGGLAASVENKDTNGECFRKGRLLNMSVST